MKRDINETCKIDEKKCGDTKESSFCIQKTSECPINSIRFIKIDEEIEDYEERIEMYDSYHSLVFS